jgi:hypothetical protein
VKRIIALSGTLIYMSLPNFAHAQYAEWVNNQGCYCGGYSSVPISYISLGTGTVAERTASQDQMEYWNRYADIFSPVTLGTGLGAPGNGLNEVNTFISSSDALSIYGLSFDPFVYGVAIMQPLENFGIFNECKDFVSVGCDAFIEVDVLLNADFFSGWTTDPNDSSRALVQTTALHEIGHAWGAHHVFTLPVFGDSYSTMNYTNDDSGRFVTRMDANTTRAHYAGVEQSVLDVGIFPLIYGNSQYAETYTSISPTSPQRGESITVSNFLVQNIGTQIAANTVITFYLSSDTTILNTDFSIGTVEFASLPVDGEYDLNATFIIPDNIPDGAYYMGAIVTVNGTEDSIDMNNRFIVGSPERTRVIVGGTTLLSENFSGGIPGTWTVVDGFSDTYTWTTSNPCDSTIPSPFAGLWAMVDSDCAGYVDMDEQLITPSVDASTCSMVFLKFANQFIYWSGVEAGDVDVSTDGSTWTNVLRISGVDDGDPTPTTKNLDISSVAAGQSDVRIRWRYYNANFDWWWAIDNVEVICVPESVGPPPPPTAAVSTDSSSYTTGNTQTLYVSLTNPGVEATVDVYIAVMLPDGSLLFVEYDINTGSYSFYPGSVDPLTWTSCVTSFTLAQSYDLSNFPLLQYTFMGNEPAGNYTWYIGLTGPGITDIIGDLGSAGFSFTP